MLRCVMASSAVVFTVFAANGALADAAMQSDTANERVEDAHHWYANIGISGILFDSSSDIFVMKNHVKDANAELTDELTATVELGYYLTPNISLALTIGLPPTSDLVGKGSFDGLALGQSTFGPLISTAKYHLTALGDSFTPYAGAGAAYTVILSDTDGVLKDLNVDGEFGAVLQVGAELKVDESRYLFADVKKVFLDASGTATTFDPASGTPLPAEAFVKLDPLILTGGIGFKF